MSKIPDREFHPLYYEIPEEVATDKTLSEIDRYIYGTIHWLEGLEKKKCIASNLTIAKATKGGITEDTARKSLLRLDNGKHILRIYSDPLTKRNRLEIVCLRSPRKKIKKKLKPYYEGDPMRKRKRDDKWFVIKNEEWLEFCGKESEILWV